MRYSVFAEEDYADAQGSEPSSSQDPQRPADGCFRKDANHVLIEDGKEVRRESGFVLSRRWCQNHPWSADPSCMFLACAFDLRGYC